MDRLVGIVALAAGLLAGVGADASPAHRGHHATPHRARVQIGVASRYGRKAAGKKTASGRPLRLGAMTAASRTLPLGTKAKVTNTETGQSAQVTITDRGPFAAGRVLDVTPKAAAAIGLSKQDGVAKVAVKPVSEPPAPPPK